MKCKAIARVQYALLLPLLALLFSLAASMTASAQCDTTNNSNCPWTYHASWVHYSDGCWLYVVYKVRKCELQNCDLVIDFMSLDEYCVCHPSITLAELLEQTVRDILGKGIIFRECDKMTVSYSACMRLETVTGGGTGGGQYQSLRYQGCPQSPCCITEWQIINQGGSRIVIPGASTIIPPGPLPCDDVNYYYPACTNVCN